MTDQQSREFHISPKFGSSGVLRISRALSWQFPGKTILQGRASTPDGQEYPVVLNVSNRTLDGMKVWLKSLPDEQDCRSFRILLEAKDPLQISISPSDTPAPLDEEGQINVSSRPKEGLFIGRVLEDQFNELVATNVLFAIQESDLLTHTFICGVTGAGKTVIGKAMIEEAALNRIPVIAIDLKGDISSLALIMSGDDPEELIPWVSPDRGQTCEQVAARLAAEHCHNLRKWGISSDFVEEAKKSIGVNVFTPRSNDGFRLSLSAFPEPPENLSEMRESDPDAYDSLIDFLAQQFVSRLSVNKTQSDKAKGYVFEIIKSCFSQNIAMHGYDGVKQVLEEFRSPGLGIDLVGDLATGEYISAKDRESLANATNSLLTGAGRRMYEGWPINIDTLVNREFAGDRTPVSIINLAHLDFMDQAYVVGYVAYLISFWMRRLPGTYDPRLIFYIDEIGGGGGKAAFFPSVASSPSKPALNLLLRQGRAQGVCCVFATQNPGDIDYKGLSNCGIWMVGRLRTRRDRSKIEQGAADADVEFESARRYLPGLGTGCFVVKTPSQPWSIVQERWLMGLHRPLAASELRQLKATYESEAKLLLDKAESLRTNRLLDNAVTLLRQIIKSYPFSALASRAFLLLARVLIEDDKFGEARAELHHLLKRWVKDEELAEARFLLGTCHENEGNFAEAVVAYEEAHVLMADPKLKEQSRVHLEYCGARNAWPTLGLGEKLIWWITSRKPEEGQILRLQVQDNDLLTEIHKSKLREIDFFLPPAVDYSLLTEARASMSACVEVDDAEKIKTLRWAESQATRITAFLTAGDLASAAKVGERIVQRLSALGLSASATVLAAIKRLSSERDSQQEKLRGTVSHLKARQFEYEIARLLQRMGYQAHATKVSGDDGVDVFARKDNDRVVVQCKRWRKPVGRAVVDELAGTAARHKATRAILATTSSFSLDAQAAATTHQIELWDFGNLCGYFKQFGVPDPTGE
jgi:HJR/Mrr/RecB family endonuclease